MAIGGDGQVTLGTQVMKADAVKVRKLLDGQVIVGFAADHGDTGLARAREKLARKGADLFVFNDVGRADIGFDAPDNEVTLVSAAGERALAKAPKDEIAAAILDEVERLLS